jgi:hypothetical protein
LLLHSLEQVQRKRMPNSSEVKLIPGYLEYSKTDD